MAGDEFDKVCEERDELQARVTDLERQLSEPGFVDALREACQGVAQLLPAPGKGHEFDQVEALPAWVAWTLETLRARLAEVEASRTALTDSLKQHSPELLEQEMYRVRVGVLEKKLAEAVPPADPDEYDPGLTCAHGVLSCDPCLDRFSRETRALRARLAEVERQIDVAIERDSLRVDASERTHAALRASEARAARLAGALGMGSAFPAPDLLDLMATWIEHLMRGHDCDHHGWEQASGSYLRAREMASAMRAALAEQETKP